MPLYFFHIRSDESEILDPEGAECPDLESARSAALVSARSIMSEEIKNGHLPLGERLDIEDRDGQLLLSVNFGEALILPPGFSLGLPEREARDQVASSS